MGLGFGLGLGLGLELRLGFGLGLELRFGLGPDAHDLQGCSEREGSVSLPCSEPVHYTSTHIAFTLALHCIFAFTLLSAQVVVDAVLCICKGPGEPIDLHMVEIMEMKHKTDTDTR